MKKIYIFSLGNPESREKGKYKYTRHNAARLLCEAFDFDAASAEGVIRPASSEKSIVGKEEVTKERKEEEEIKITHIAPDTYMNESGIFIKKYMRYNNINLDQIIIVYDDKDIEVCDVKVGINRTAGGHNGVESIIQSLNTKEFYRLRVGIGAKIVPEMLLQDYVLSKLNESEIETFTLKGDMGKKLNEVFANKLKDIINNLK